MAECISALGPKGSFFILYIVVHECAWYYALAQETKMYVYKWRVHLQKTINGFKKKIILHISEPQKPFVKKACIVPFQGIASSHFTAEADKRPCVCEQKPMSPF